MTKDEIKAYYWLAVQLREERAELSELRTKATNATQKISDMPGSKTAGDKIGYYAVKLTEAKKALKNREEKAKEIRAKLVDFVKAIDDPLMREIIQYRYLNLLSWRMVAYFVGGTHSEDSVRKRAERFLESL